MDHQDSNTKTDETTDLPGGDIAARPALTIDYGKYEHFLENADLTEDQKREFLDALWAIICEFVWLGFGVHPVQQAQEACGKLDQNTPKPTPISAYRIDSQHTKLISNFMSASVSRELAKTKGETYGSK